MSHDPTRREFVLLAGSFLSIGLPLNAFATDAGVDVDWRSSNPFLSGNFLPVKKETQAAPLTVSYDKIPEQLDGTYLRNGLNPLFEPLTFTYPLDGDGMIHAVRLQNGKASYRNRFVQTSALALERRAGRAVYGSVARPANVPPELLLPSDSRSSLKNGVCINVIRHGDHLLALSEANTVYELNEDLETLGLWKAGRESQSEWAHTIVVTQRRVFLCDGIQRARARREVPSYQCVGSAAQHSVGHTACANDDP